jgi:hypothetical protein
MNLGFSQKFKNGDATHFVAKIWNCLMLSEKYEEYAGWFLDQTAQIPMNETLKPKLHTIREDKTDRWSAGKLIHFIINNRQPNRFQFAPVIPVVTTQEINIWPNPSGVTVQIDGLYQSRYEIETLAINDGFDSYEAFAAYFNQPFSGKIIHWTNLKY